MVKIENIQLPDFPLLLAPMEDVSDPPFRAVCKDNGADLMYTEFISSEGLIRDAIKSRKKLDIFDYERPVGIQIFGGDEDSLALAAKIVEVTNPDHSLNATGQAEGITTFPTWKFQDGTKVTGVLSLAEISTHSGICLRVSSRRNLGGATRTVPIGRVVRANTRIWPGPKCRKARDRSY